MTKKRKGSESWAQNLTEQKPSVFWWSLFIFLLAILTVLSWVVIPSVFNNPHIPSHYKWLTAIGREPKIKSFEALEPPNGDIMETRNIYNKFFNFKENEIKALNDALLKNYIFNYKYDIFNTYLQGDFRVIQTRKLTKNDVFPDGIVIQAEAMVKTSNYSDETSPYPVWIEFILPSAPAGAEKTIHKGDLMSISKSPHFASILHLSHIVRPDDDSIIYLTVVPLVYESPWIPPHGERFSISPPKRLNLNAKFPILKL